MTTSKKLHTTFKFLLAALLTAVIALPAQARQPELTADEDDFVIIENTPVSPEQQDKQQQQLNSFYKSWEALKSEGLSRYVVQGTMFGEENAFEDQPALLAKVLNANVASTIGSIGNTLGTAYASQSVQAIVRLVSWVSFFSEAKIQNTTALMLSGAYSESLVNVASKISAWVYPGKTWGDLYMRRQLIGNCVMNLGLASNCAASFLIHGGKLLFDMGSDRLSDDLKNYYVAELCPEGPQLNVLAQEAKLGVPANEVTWLSQDQKARVNALLTQVQALEAEGLRHQAVQMMFFGKEAGNKTPEELSAAIEQRMKDLPTNVDPAQRSAAMQALCAGMVLAQPFIQKEVTHLIAGTAGPEFLHYLTMTSNMIRANLGSGWVVWSGTTYMKGVGANNLGDICSYVAYYMIEAVKSGSLYLWDSAYALAKHYLPIGYESGKSWATSAYNYAYDTMFGSSEKAAVVAQPPVVAQPAKVEAPKSWSSWLMGW